MRRIAIVATLVVVASACGGLNEQPSPDTGGFPDGAISIIASTDVAVGPSRLNVAVAESDGGRLGSPQDIIAIEVAPADQPELRQRTTGVFTWIIEDAFGLYRADFDFSRPGPWNVTVVPEAGRPLAPSTVVVYEETIAPNVGDLAPLVSTPTGEDQSLDAITTDPEPDPRFYRMSLDEAVRSGTPTVVVFSTPAFCRTATCGPVLEQTKEVAAGYPNVNFVHVEIYTGFTDPDFVPDGAHLAPAVTSSGWNLPSEPWVFVVDGRGVVTHRFEGVMDSTELRAALG
ncbi:MAG: thioredoxin family protein [Acidimicrobiia bacterium]|nr:thioredoxin family protein [Acidimicrobiia bacterium]